jgi:hypothetical protein
MADYQNSRLVEWSLLFFSTFIVIVLICNVIEYSHLIDIKNNPNFSDDSAQYWLIINIVLLVIAVIYWIYRVYHFFLSPGLRSNIAEKANKYFLETEYTGVIGTKGEDKATFKLPVESSYRGSGGFYKDVTIETSGT